jgi:hypothetical protein
MSIAGTESLFQNGTGIHHFDPLKLRKFGG